MPAGIWNASPREIDTGADCAALSCAALSIVPGEFSVASFLDAWNMTPDDTNTMATDDGSHRFKHFAGGNHSILLGTQSHTTFLDVEHDDGLDGTTEGG